MVSDSTDLEYRNTVAVYIFGSNWVADVGTCYNRLILLPLLPSFPFDLSALFHCPFSQTDPFPFILDSDSPLSFGSLGMPCYSEQVVQIFLHFLELLQLVPSQFCSILLLPVPSPVRKVYSIHLHCTHGDSLSCVKCCKQYRADEIRIWVPD